MVLPTDDRTNIYENALSPTLLKFFKLKTTFQVFHSTIKDRHILH